MPTAPHRVPHDGSGYEGPLRYVEFAQGGNNNRGFWDDYQSLATKVYDAAFTSGKPWHDSHIQIAHYRRELPWALPKRRDGEPEDPERKEKLNEQPQLANFIIDLDDENVEVAQEQARRLVDYYLTEAEVPEEALHIGFSTSKGFHISVPWQLLGVTSQGVPALNWLTYKSIAHTLRDKLELTAMDEGIYRMNGFIRMENTVHPKTGLFKIRITPTELAGDIEALRELAEKPRRDLYPQVDRAELLAQPSPLLERLYRPAQAKADAKLAAIRTGMLSRPVPAEALEQLQGELTPCLQNIPQMVTPERPGNRNNTAFRAVMMLNHIGRDRAEADAYLRDWLGPAYGDVGADATLDSVYDSGYSGGCSWMREHGFANNSECQGCPVWQKGVRKIQKEDERPELPDANELPSIYDARPKLLDDLREINPFETYIVRTPAGFGKTYATLQRAMEIVSEGNRVVVFVKDTKKAAGLAAELKVELQKLGFDGKVQTLYGRNLNPEDERNNAPINCDNYKTARNYQKKGYSVGAKLCPKCPFRQSCDYYRQYDFAYEPGIYIAAHAMLPYLFAEEDRGFSTRTFYWNPETAQKRTRAKARKRRAKTAVAKAGETDDVAVLETGDKGGELPAELGGELDLIVIDEDALDSWLDETIIYNFQLEKELEETSRVVRRFNGFTGQNDIEKHIELDPNWLRVIRWTIGAAHRNEPIIRSLQDTAKREGTDIRAVLYSITPARIVDPDYEENRGHRPFTSMLYHALLQDAQRLEEGNPVVMGGGGDVTIYGIQEIKFPYDVPVVFLDAYARVDRYKSYFRRARISRRLNVLDYEVQETPHVTYVLGVALTAGEVRGAINGESRGTAKLEKIVEALKILTEDEVTTKIVAKKELLDSDVLQGMIEDYPHLVTEDDGGTLHWWRGRGINSAKGERIAIIQDPNPRPDVVRNEASVLFPDEPTLDTDRVVATYEVPWSHHAPDPQVIRVDRYDYADERLNMIQRAKREDEMVQMAMRGRSITTGAEILVFSDYVDPRLPAEKVYTLDGLINGMVGKSEIRTALYEYIEDTEPDLLTVDFLAYIGVVDGQGTETKEAKALKRKMMRELGGYYFKLKREPIEEELAREELAAYLKEGDD